MKSAAAGRKPNSVRLPPACASVGGTIIPLGPALLTGSSDLPGSFERAVLSSAFALAGDGETSPPYLVLLRAGFCLPSALQQTRCALTAPFHPYPVPGRPHPAQLRRASRWRPAREPRHSAWSRANDAGGMFSVPLVLQVTLTGRYPAHCPAEFGLSSRLAASDRLAHCDMTFYRTRDGLGRLGIRSNPNPQSLVPNPCFIRPSPAVSRTARASCRGCSGACRSLRRSSRCSTRSRAAFQRATRARRTP